MEDQINNRSVWRVTVYEDNGSETFYYFWRRNDVMESIQTTWSQRPNSIVIYQMPSTIVVKSNDLLAQCLLKAEIITVGYLIRDRSDHF